MKMIFDGTQITCNDAKQVREDMKEFKSRYTDGDLEHMAWKQLCEKYEELTGEHYPSSGEIVRAIVQAYAHDWQGTHFRVEFLLFRYDEICEISYYTDMDMNIDTEGHWNPFKGRWDYLFNVRRFKIDGSMHDMITSEGVQSAV